MASRWFARPPATAIRIRPPRRRRPIAWYYAPGTPSDAINAHWPAEATEHGGGSDPVTYFSFGFDDLPGSRSVMNGRSMFATIGTAKNGRTVIRVDAVVIWVPSRDPDSIIRNGAASATVVTTSPMTAAPINTTDPAVIRGIVDDIDALTPPVSGTVFCGGKPQQTLSGGGDLVVKVYSRLGVTWTPPR